jgi:predicted TIM-barrel fold metal-dependent hydrolase
MPTIVDADTHVIESDATWEGMAELGFGEERPIALYRDPVASSPASYWLFDKRIFPRGGVGIDGTRTPRGARELDDVPMRLADMDRLGVDRHVIYSTFFLGQPTERPGLLAALCRSYNDWVAGACKESKGRLAFAAVLPLLDIHDAIEELHRTRDLGAVAVHLRGYEGDRMLTDPYFFPLYAQALQLDVALCIHAGSANRYLDDQMFRGGFPFLRNKLPVIGAFNALAESDVPERFPGLRFGFIEAAASWLPYMMFDLERRIERRTGDRRSIGQSFLTDRHFYVTCQVNDDLTYLMEQVGPDNLVVGSDYGHADNASELEAVRRVGSDERLSESAREQITSKSALSLYGLE